MHGTYIKLVDSLYISGCPLCIFQFGMEALGASPKMEVTAAG